MNLFAFCRKRLPVVLAPLLFLCSLFLCFPIPARAEEGTAVYETIRHVHTGGAGNGGGCYSVPAYHVHVGDPVSGGGCYTAPVYHAHTQDCYGIVDKSVTVCRENQGNWDDFQHSEYEWCGHCENSCERQYYTGVSFRIAVRDGSADDIPAEGSYHFCDNCNYTCFCFSYNGETYEVYGESPSNAAQEIGASVPVNCLTCGKEETTVETYGLGCGKTQESVDGWQLGCGMEETTEVARFGLRLQEVGWSRQTALTASCEILTDCGLPEAAFSWNGGEVISDSRFSVEENGDYSCELRLGENTDAAAHELHLTVENIDRDAPEVSLSASQGWSREILTEAQAQDGQSGVAGYSWDGGRTWTMESSFRAAQNGEVALQVKDAAGNVANKSILIAQVDRQAPEAMLSWEPKGWSRESVTLCVNAADAPSDGGTGSGLAEQAYSYDGGLNWTGENRLQAGQNGTYEVLVRDRAGNRTRRSLILDRIDREGPQVKLTAQPAVWKEGNARICVEAADTGTGLAKTPFQWADSGWSGLAEREAEASGTYEVTVYDKLGNFTKASVTLTKETPPVEEPPAETPEEKPPTETPEGEPPAGTPEEKPTETGPAQEPSFPEEQQPTAGETETGAEPTEELQEAAPALQKEEGQKLRPLFREAPEEQRKAGRVTAVGDSRMPAAVFWTLAALVGLLLLAALAWLLILLLRGIRIYNYAGEESYVYLGLEFAEKKGDCWQLAVQRELYEECDTLRFRLRCSVLFAKLHEGEELLVILPEGEKSVAVGRQMEFSL